MKILAGIILAVFLTGMLVAACFAVVNDDESMAPVRLQLVRYDEQPQCYDDGYCDDDNYQSGGDYSSRDRHRNERRNRGAFSPGPFDRSPVTIWFCPQPNSCNNGDGSQPPDNEGQP